MFPQKDASEGLSFPLRILRFIETPSIMLQVVFDKHAELKDDKLKRRVVSQNYLPMRNREVF